MQRTGNSKTLVKTYKRYTYIQKRCSQEEGQRKSRPIGGNSKKTAKMSFIFDFRHTPTKNGDLKTWAQSAKVKIFQTKVEKYLETKLSLLEIPAKILLTSNV